MNPSHVTTISTLVIAVLTTLTMFGFTRSCRAESAADRVGALSALLEIERGVQLLEHGDRAGILNLLEARKQAPDQSRVQQAAEWLWAGWLSQQQLIALLEHQETADPGAAIIRVAFIPDGKRVATASLDKTARIWDVETGQAVGPPLRHEELVPGVAFSLDGGFVATAAFDRTARLWDASTGEPVGEPFQHEEPLHGVSFSPDGRLLVTAALSGDAPPGHEPHGTAQIWDLETREPVLAVEHPGGIMSAVFSPDGALLATVTNHRTARLGHQHRRARHTLSQAQPRSRGCRLQPGRRPTGNRFPRHDRPPVGGNHRRASRRPHAA